MATTPQFHLSRKDLNAVTPNKSKSYYSDPVHQSFVIESFKVFVCLAILHSY